MKRTLWVVAVGFMGAASPLAAQGSGSLGQEHVELMPFVGYRTGGSFTAQLNASGLEPSIKSDTSYGGVIDFNLHQGNFKLEALYSRQSSDIQSAGLVLPNGLPITVEYLQGGVSQESGSEKGRFYISFLLGATKFDPQGFDSSTKFSTSLGGGLKFFFSPHAGLRFDARAFLTFVNGDAAGICANGTCLLSYSGSHFWQGDFTAGLILAF